MSERTPIWFCPQCHAEVDARERRCPHCGADFAAWDAQSYGERLIRALVHPLSEVRMGAIVAMGKRADSRAAVPLARCALAHPRDLVQGLAIVDALARMPDDAVRAQALRTLCSHPANAVAQAAALLSQPADATSSDAGAPAAIPVAQSSSAHIIEWCRDLAGHAQHEPRIAALGIAAIPGLRAVLDAPPEAVNAARLFAVAMLARIDNAAARTALRSVLYHPPLTSLQPQVAEAERVVKAAALHALAARDYPERGDDIAWALQVPRLVEAAHLAGTLRLHSVAAALARMLDDDVLARPAADALHAMPQAVPDALRAPLRSWLARVDARARLATVRALLLLADLGQCPAPALWRAAWRAAHPAPRAAAAVCAWARCPRTALLPRLLEGALLQDAALAAACREALVGVPDWPLALLRTGLRCARGMPDMYGDLQPLARTDRRWLSAQLISRACRRRPQRLLRLPGALLDVDLAGGALPDADQADLPQSHPRFVQRD